MVVLLPLLAALVAPGLQVPTPQGPVLRPPGSGLPVPHVTVPEANDAIKFKKTKNVAVILVDDWGMDMLEIYGVGDLSAGCITRPPTPNIDRLIQAGVTFQNAWVLPVCSPTRASLLTGRMPYRHKLGRIVDQCSLPGCPPEDELSPQEFTIPEMLREGAQLGMIPDYGSAAVGKWHLGPDPMAPQLQGFDRYRGSQHNIGRNDNPTETYCNWLKNIDGAFSMSSTYATTDSIDESLSFIRDRGDNPWFLYLALHAGHAPFHAPPAHLAPSYFINDGSGNCFHAQLPNCAVQPALCPPLSCPLAPCAPACDLPLTEPRLDQIAAKRPYYEAMLEALDTELGRLFGGIDLDETTVFLLGDNGTPGTVTSRPFLGDRLLGIPAKSKGSIYQGGVNVPFIVAGAGVKGARPGRPARIAREMIHVVDVYATIADLLGVDAVSLGAISPNPIDSVSFKPLLRHEPSPGRPTLFCELFAPNFPTSQDPCSLTMSRALRNNRYKLLRFTDTTNCSGPFREELYDLWVDRFELTELMVTGAHLNPGPVRDNYLRLKAELDSIPLP